MELQTFIPSGFETVKSRPVTGWERHTTTDGAEHIRVFCDGARAPFFVPKAAFEQALEQDLRSLNEDFLPVESTMDTETTASPILYDQASEDNDTTITSLRPAAYSVIELAARNKTSESSSSTAIFDQNDPKNRTRTEIVADALADIDAQLASLGVSIDTKQVEPEQAETIPEYGPLSTEQMKKLSIDELFDRFKIEVKPEHYDKTSKSQTARNLNRLNTLRDIHAGTAISEKRFSVRDILGNARDKITGKPKYRSYDEMVESVLSPRPRKRVLAGAAVAIATFFGGFAALTNKSEGVSDTAKQAADVIDYTPTTTTEPAAETSTTIFRGTKPMPMVVEVEVETPSEHDSIAKPTVLNKPKSLLDVSVQSPTIISEEVLQKISQLDLSAAAPYTLLGILNVAEGARATAITNHIAYYNATYNANYSLGTDGMIKVGGRTIWPQELELLNESMLARYNISL